MAVDVTGAESFRSGPSTIEAKFEAGQNEVTITIPTVADDTEEENADLTIALQLSRNYVVDDFGSLLTIEIRDDDAADVTRPAVVIAAPDRATQPVATTFTFSEPVLGFALDDIIVGNGQASGFVAVSDAVYQATITPDATTQARIAVTVDVAENIAEDASGNGNTAARQVRIRFGSESLIRRLTRRLISNFITRRADQITAAEPDLAQRLNRRGSGGETGPVSLSGRGEGGNSKLSFSTGLRQALGAEAQRKEKQRSGLLSGGNGLGVSSSGSQAADVESVFDIWVKGKWARATSDGVEHDLGLLHVGADYRLNQNLVIGVLGQFDWSDEKGDSIDGSDFRASGQGWMIGPYVVGRLHDNVIFDARIAAGRSTNEVSPFASYTDEYEADRWLAKGQLTGDFSYGRWHFAPHVGVTYFEETQKQYVDSFGITIPKQTVNLGRLTFGPKFSTRVTTGNGTIITPSIAVKGIWDFAKSDLYDLETGAVRSRDELRARADVGLAIELPSGIAVSGEGFYDGIAATDDYRAFGGSVSVKIPLQRE